jgi:hypothetical protein
MSHSQPPEPPTFGKDTPVADVLLRSLEQAWQKYRIDTYRYLPHILIII